MPRESVKKGIHIHRIYLPKLKFIAFVLFLLKAVLALNKIDSQIVHIQGVYSMGLCGFFSDYSPSSRKGLLSI
jgi:hypothetical protein